MEVVQLLVCKVEFSKGAAEVVTNDLRTEYCSVQGHCSAYSRNISVSVWGVESYYFSIESYRSTLNHVFFVFVLACTELAAIRIIN